jgi:hypothetical protein
MLQRIILHLARTHGFPEGSAQHGYEIMAPLNPEGHLDAEEWQGERSRCWVRRFWNDEPDRYGLLVHRPGGAGGATWIIDYDRAKTDDDEAGYRLDTHTFRAGEYVSIRDADGDLNTFKVIEVRPMANEPTRS